MRRVVLIHWKPEEAALQVAGLRRFELEVEVVTPCGMSFVQALKANLPDAILIDLSRLPMQGRDVAIQLRRAQATRNVPLIFLGGEPGKVNRVKQVLPDAAFASVPELRGAINRAMTKPPGPVNVPASGMAGYAGTPLLKKLRIEEDTKVTLINAPPGLLDDLAGIPLARAPDLVLWFVRSPEELESRVDALAAHLRTASLWIIWPKRKARAVAGLSQTVVRRTAQAAGLAEYKICSLDSTWSGLLFSRKTRAPGE